MQSARSPSNRSFGALCVVVLALAAAYGAWRGASWYRWPLGLSLLTLVVTLLTPKVLTPFNRAWMTLGELLGKIVNPIVLGAIFFLVITPTGIVMRRTGRDAMLRRREPSAPTYWKTRPPPGFDPASMHDQF